MTPIEHSNDGRTLMTAVLFADLVGYSRKPVTDQLAAKEALRDFLQAVLAALAPESRVVMDTGDGAAVAFLADPEHALYFAMRLRRNVMAAEHGLLRPEDLRLGINLGPVRWVVDVNGRPNLLGDGMNSAERVMSFAAPGETTASRSFRDAVSCLHASYQELFEPMGQRADKHGRQHEVFRIGASLHALDVATTSLGSGPLVGWNAAETGLQLVTALPEMRSHTSARRVTIAIAAATVMVVIGVWTWFPGGPGVRTPEETQPVPAADLATVERVAPVPDGNPNSPVSSEPRVIVREIEMSTANLHSTTATRESEAQASREDGPVASSVVPGPTTVPRASARAVKSTRLVPGALSSTRCTLLLQRVALGEELNASEQEEFRKLCR